MRMRGGMAAALLAGAAFAQESQPAASPPAATAPAAGVWRATATRLASSDATQRALGEKDIEPAVLHDLGPAADPAAVKAEIDKRARALIEQAALHPPSITLSLKDATAGQTTAALQAATGFDQWWISGGGPFTLDVADAPFWSVFLALNQQGDVSLQGQDQQAMMGNGRFRGGFRGRMIGIPTIRQGVRVGDFLAFASTLSYTRQADLQEDAKPSESLQMNFGVAADPRIKIVAWSEPHLTLVVDDQGHTLYQESVDPQRSFSRSYGSPNWCVQGNVSLAVAGGTKIASAKGTAKAAVQLREARAEIADFARQGKTPLVVGLQKVTVQTFDLQSQMVRFDLRLEPAGTASQTDRTDVNPPLMSIDISDAAGTEIYHGDISNGWGGSWGGQYKAPIKATFTAPAETKTVDVDFELKDIPLPR